MAIIKVCFCEDEFGTSTGRYELVDELKRGRYLVRPITFVDDLYGNPRIVRGSLRIVSEVSGIHEEEIDGEKNV